MTDEHRDEAELETKAGEPESPETDEDEEPDFELHGQFFEAPSE